MSVRRFRWASNRRRYAPFRTLTAPDWKATVLTSRFLDSGLSLLAAALEESAASGRPGTCEMGPTSRACDPTAASSTSV
ncbi:hypothetical protein [Pseudonocardia alaniniphila]|uniref:Uncharacterized protein n=1 Tax=Pseudonocardia alaniniphila TaxID=75291 RepID=A0ABS9TT49_9PSEU|nr:hypothetical protein [Pseudonocardia alaniniphila]MCH6171676.1 hypothetical protein [Pseudonocardia alaniniphila]